MGISRVMGVAAVLASLAMSDSARAHDAKIQFPEKLDCEAPRGAEASFAKPFRIYTRLGRIRLWSDITVPGVVTVWSDVKGGKRRPDEVASTWADNDYFGAGIDVGAYTYSTWSCDTTDFVFTFKTKELFAYKGLAPKTKQVLGQVLIRTRGQVDYDGFVSCVAIY